METVEEGERWAGCRQSEALLAAGPHSVMHGRYTAADQ